VKVDPKSLGVGQYQHDINPVHLKRSLEGVVDSCVNAVGVDVNTASTYLLARVSGIGPALAKAILERRQTKGLFRARTELKEVPRFSDKVFEQAAGFLRIRGGTQALDNTGVHPERYTALEQAAQRLGKKLSDLVGEGAKLLEKDSVIRAELGDFTFRDVIQELAKPGRDPREPFEAFSFREDVSKIEDLKPGMQLPGIVTNVTNFGAFVDVGVHQDGLVHISHLADRFVKDPREIVEPGQTVHVKILEVDVAKKRISLTMKLAEKSESAPQARGQATGSRGASSKPSAPRGAPEPKFSNNPFAALGVLKSGK
jgi:uncharacterized protein